VKPILGEPTRILNRHGKLTEPFAYEYQEGQTRIVVFMNADGIVYYKSQEGLD
jgi:hypothetical protein